MDRLKSWQGNEPLLVQDDGFHPSSQTGTRSSERESWCTRWGYVSSGDNFILKDYSSPVALFQMPSLTGLFDG